MLKMIFLTLGVTSFSVLAGGCATVGKQFEFKNPEAIQIGATTKKEVLEKFGEPFRVGYDNNRLKWTYGYYKYRVFGDSDTKDLAITFDEKNLVKDFTYSTSFEEEKKEFAD